MNDDAQLIAQTLTGRAAAFGELVLKYQDRLYNALVHTMGSKEDARDVVQDAFLQAYLKLSTFHQSSGFYTWLYRIAFNVAASQRRRKRPVVSVEQVRESSGQEPVAVEANPGDRLEQEERQQLIREAIAQLSEEHRVVLVLREIEGLCYESIAEILELPVGTVRSRLHRARLQLRDQLALSLTGEDE